MRIKLVIILFFCLSIFSEGWAQQNYWVEFRDKQGVEFNPGEYFDAKGLEKSGGIESCSVDFYDLPVNSAYCSAIEEVSPVRVKSRWLNAVSVSLTGEQVKNIRQLEFVKDIHPVYSSRVLPAMKRGEDPDPGMLDHIHRQTEVMGGEYFRNKGITGKGVRIAVFDGGFPGVDTLSAFKHLFDEGRIIATWDFVNDNEYVYDFNSHGTSVLGCIAGIYHGTPMGLGSGAEFLLARTEVRAEIFEEEENWAAAVEWAYKNGADIISSSLGYTYHRYFPRNMDGKTVFVSRIASLAARKGILVINSAGNDGDSDWQVIGAPADADSILSIGGISSSSGIHIDFSSYGPTYDGRLKPNVVAFGDAVTVGKAKLKKAYGTSFSAPLISGFAACVMEMHPGWNNIKVLKEIEKSGNLYPYYDYAHGYGVPNAGYFTGSVSEAEKTFHFNKKVNVIEICLEKSDDTSESMEAGNDFDRYFLYFHIASEKTGMIRRYKVVKMQEADSYAIPLDSVKKGEVLRAHYNGYTETFRF